MGIFGDKSKGDFLAHIDIHPCGPEADKRNAPPFNGIRWDLVYLEDFEKYAPQTPPYNMVWPEFLDQSGVFIPSGIPLIGSYDAKMHVVVRDRVEYHMDRIKIGTKFYCMEGALKAATGMIIKTSI